MDGVKALTRQYVIRCFGVDGSGELERLVRAILCGFKFRLGHHGSQPPVLWWPPPPFPAEPPRQAWRLPVATRRPLVPQRPRKSWSPGW